MLLLPGNAKQLINILGQEIGPFGWLLSPRRTMTVSGLFGWQYAVDNECYTLGTRFNPTRFCRALDRISRIHGIGACLFVVAPDVVADSRATLAQFPTWREAIAKRGFPVALAAQNGIEDLDIPWLELDALFIGGTTEWKLSAAAADLIREGKRRGKWMHMGRVNSTKRASRLLEHPDSVDGTAWAKHPAYYAKQWKNWVQAGKPSFIGSMF